MLQERNENGAAKAGDLILAIGLIMLAVFSNIALKALAPTLDQGIGQMVAFLLFVAACGLIYKKRLSAYRYTLYYQELDEGDGGEYNQTPEHQFPLGTLLVESMVGDNAQTVLEVAAGEMLALFKPDGPSSIITGNGGNKSAKIHKLSLTKGPKIKAHSLFFCQQGKCYRLYFSPSDEMARLLNEAIAAAHNS